MPVSLRERIPLQALGAGPGDVVAGSEEERAVAENARGFFESLGLEVGVYEFEAMSWRERYAEVSAGGFTVRAVAMPYTLSGDVEAPAVYAGAAVLEEEWLPLEVEGKVALVMFHEKVDEAVWQYLGAVKRGAEAVVFVDRYPGRRRRMVLTLNTDYRFSEGTPPPVPAVAVSLEDGLRLARLARSGARLRVVVEASVDHSARSRVVYAGRLDGPVLSAHIDKWLSGFTDDALGVGLVLLLAEKLRDRAGYVLFGSEESGAPGYSPWYWIWGSRSFAEYLERRGLLDDFGLLLNADVLGGSSLIVSASTPDLQSGLSQLLGEEARVDRDQVIFDSFSFTMKGVPAATFHTFPEVLPVYHTDLDLPALVDWVGVERALKLIERVASEFVSRKWGLLHYRELVAGIARRLEKVAFLPAAQEALDLLAGLRVESEEEARALRRALTSPLFWGRYDRVFRDSEAYYPLFTDAIDDLLLVMDVLAGARDPGELRRARGLRRVAGFEEVLPSVEPVFYGRLFSSPVFLRELYSVLERIVEKDLYSLMERVRALKK